MEVMNVWMRIKQWVYDITGITSIEAEEKAFWERVKVFVDRLIDERDRYHLELRHAQAEIRNLVDEFDELSEYTRKLENELDQ